MAQTENHSQEHVELPATWRVSQVGLQGHSGCPAVPPPRAHHSPSLPCRALQSPLQGPRTLLTPRTLLPPSSALIPLRGSSLLHPIQGPSAFPPTPADLLAPPARPSSAPPAYLQGLAASPPSMAIRFPSTTPSPPSWPSRPPPMPSQLPPAARSASHVCLAVFVLWLASPRSAAWWLEDSAQLHMCAALGPTRINVGHPWPTLLRCGPLFAKCCRVEFGGRRRAITSEIIPQRPEVTDTLEPYPLGTAKSRLRRFVCSPPAARTPPHSITRQGWQLVCAGGFGCATAPRYACRQRVQLLVGTSNKIATRADVVALGASSRLLRAPWRART